MQFCASPFIELLLKVDNHNLEFSVNLRKIYKSAEAITISL